MTKGTVSQATLATIASKLKDTPEQKNVVGPIVAYLVRQGWELEQIIFGKTEWRVPKTPSQATRREKKQHYDGFPVDVAVFDSPTYVGDYRHLLFIIECKQPDETAGVSQLEAYYAVEPHAKLGIWANNPDPGAPAVFLYRQEDRALLKRRKVGDLPPPGEAIKPEAQRLTFNDLIKPTEATLRRTVSGQLSTRKLPLLPRETRTARRAAGPSLFRCQFSARPTPARRC